MYFCGKESRFNKGDKIVLPDGITATVYDVGVIGSKLSPWVFVYTVMTPGKGATTVAESDKIKIAQ